MSRFRFAIAVAATSLSIVALLAIVAVPFARAAVAGGLAPVGFNGPWHGGDRWGHGPELPRELEGLTHLPHDQWFEHFKGAGIDLTDRDGAPLRVNVTPGTVDEATGSSVSIATNEGVTRSFGLDESTISRGPLTRGERVVAVTVNDSSTATAVIALRADGSGPWWRH